MWNTTLMASDGLAIIVGMGLALICYGIGKAIKKKPEKWIKAGNGWIKAPTAPPLKRRV